MRTIGLFALCAASLIGAEQPQRMYISVERMASTSESTGWVAVNAAHVFEGGERLRFHIKTTFPGYLYVMDQGTTGSYELLFPRPDTGNDNRIEAAKDYIIPAADGTFRITGPAGHDRIFWLISPVELGDQYKPLPPPAEDSALPSNIRPRCDDSIFKARGDCIDTTAGLKPLTSDDKIPVNMNGVVRSTPPEVLFIQDNSVGRESVVISSPTPLTGPVVYELRLAHR